MLRPSLRYPAAFVVALMAGSCGESTGPDAPAALSVSFATSPASVPTASAVAGSASPSAIAVVQGPNGTLPLDEVEIGG